jgi:hypothetical protein
VTESSAPSKRTHWLVSPKVVSAYDGFMERASANWVHTSSEASTTHALVRPIKRGSIPLF